MDIMRIAATGLVVGVIGPIFWLAVGKLDLWIKSTPFGQRMIRLGDRINAWPSAVLQRRRAANAARAAQHLSQARRVRK